MASVDDHTVITIFATETIKVKFPLSVANRVVCDGMRDHNNLIFLSISMSRYLLGDVFVVRPFDACSFSENGCIYKDCRLAILIPFSRPIRWKLARSWNARNLLLRFATMNSNVSYTNNSSYKLNNRQRQSRLIFNQLNILYYILFSEDFRFKIYLDIIFLN